MISNYDHTTEPVALTLPYHFANEPFEAELRNRLHDILEEWESSTNYQDPITAAIIFGMIDQISDAMYPPEEDADD